MGENVVYAPKEYSFLKKKEMMQYMTTCMNLEDVVLSELTSFRWTTIAWFYLWGSKVVQLMEAKHRLVIARGRVEGGMEVASQWV